MVNLDDGEKWENEARKKEHDRLRTRIERTSSGYEWIMRVDYLGKNNPFPSAAFEDDPDE